MPGLYGYGNANVTTSVTNTTGLYIGGGSASVLNNAQQLLTLLSNTGTVGFSLTGANTKVLASVLPSGVISGTYGNVDYFPVVTVGGDGRVSSVSTISVTSATGGYGNANVASFLPHYGGTINAFTVFNESGLAVQGKDYAQLQWTNGQAVPASEYDIGTGSWFYLDAGGGVFQSNSTGTLKTITYGNDASINAGGNITAPYFLGDGSLLTNLPTGSNYGNANVAVYLPYDPTITGIQANIGGSQTYANVTFATKTALQTLNANLGAFETYANATFGTSSFGNANVAAYLPTDSNIKAIWGNLQTINANLGAFETYGNLTFATKSALQVVDANLGTATTNITTLFSNAATQATAITTNATNIQTLNANLGAFETYANATFGTSSYGNTQAAAWIKIDPTITALQANVGAYEIWANARIQTLDANLGTATTNITALQSNAGSQAADINTLFSNAATQATAINTINANLGAFETYANATFSTSTYGNTQAAAWIKIDPTITALQANVGAFETYANLTFSTTANAASQQTQIDTLNANVGAFETYGNLTFATKSALQTLDANLGTATTNITTLFSNAATQATAINTINANLGAYQTYANSAISTNSTNIQTLNANVGAFETYGNLTFATKSALQVIDANLGTATTNITTLFSNAATQATAINTLNANVGAFETYANIQFATNTYSNTNVAAYLPVYGGTVLSDKIINTVGISTGNVYGSSDVTVQAGAGYAAYSGPSFNVNAATTNVSGQIDIGGGSLSGYSGYALVVKDSGAANMDGIQIQGGFGPAGSKTALLAATGNVTLQNGNVVTSGANNWLFGNVITGGGIFWTNGAAYSTQSTYGNTEVAAYISNNGVSVGATGVISSSNLSDVSDASLAPVTGSFVLVGGGSIGKSVKVFGTANVGNVITTSGIFWANGVNYSTTITPAAAAGFSGNLAGNVLYDGINGRIFANAFPLSAPSTSNQATTSTITNVPVYTGGILQQPATGNQTTNMILSSNVSLQSKYDAVNKNTVGTYQYLQVWPSTANSMTNSDRVRAGQTALDVQLNGKQWFSSNISNSFALVGAQSGITILGTGSAGHTVGQFNFVGQTPTGGSANIGFATGTYSLVQTATTGTGYTASNIGVARLFSGCVIVAGNLSITNAVGLHTVSGWGSTATNKYALLNEDTTTTITTNGNIVQAGFSPALTATFSNVAYTGSMSPGFQFTANTSGSLTGNVFYLGNVNYASLQQVSLDSNISVVATTSATARQFDFLVYSYGTKNINWPVGSTIYGNIIPNSTTYAKVTQYGSVSTVTVAYTQDPSTWYSNVNAQSYTLSNVVLNAYAEKQVALGNQSGTVTVNNNQGPVQTMTLTGSITINTANMSNFVTGKSVTLIITQGGSGSYTLTSDIKFAGGSKTLSTAVGAIDTITIYYDGTNYLASLVKGYA